MRLIVREFCLMSGQDMVLSGHVQTKPVFLKMGCPAMNVLWFCHMNTNCRQQDILQEDKTLLQLSQKANSCIKVCPQLGSLPCESIGIRSQSQELCSHSKRDTESLLDTASRICINKIFLMSSDFFPQQNSSKMHYFY